MVITEVIDAVPGSITVRLDDGMVIERRGGTVSWRCNNPGNLKHGSFAKQYGSIGKDYIGHAIFPTVEEGKRAHTALLFSEDSRYYKLTIQSAINRYAPAGDANNQPKKYANYLAENVGVSTSTKLCDLTEDQRSEFIDYMRNYEGFKKGKNIEV